MSALILCMVLLQVGINAIIIWFLWVLSKDLYACQLQIRNVRRLEFEMKYGIDRYPDGL